MSVCFDDWLRSRQLDYAGISSAGSAPYHTRSVRDISMTMLVALNAGLLLWVVYGFWIHSMPLVVANVFTFILAFLVLVMKKGVVSCQKER